MSQFKTKTQVGYKITMGMRAVGNQCRDCAHSTQSEQVAGDLFCVEIRQRVKPSGACSSLRYKDDADSVNIRPSKRLVALYTRINGVERMQVSPELESRDGQSGQDGRNGRGMEIRGEFHEALGLKAGGVR